MLVKKKRALQVNMRSNFMPLVALRVIACVAIILCYIKSGAPARTPTLHYASEDSQDDSKLVVLVSTSQSLQHATPVRSITLYARAGRLDGHDTSAWLFAKFKKRPTLPSLTWEVTSPSFSLLRNGDMHQSIHTSDGVNLVGETFGRTLVTATFKNQRSSLPAFYFPSIALGCNMRAESSHNFDADSQSNMDPTAADVYFSNSIEQSRHDRCTANSGIAANEMPVTINFPYGATIVNHCRSKEIPIIATSACGPFFEQIRPSAFRHSFTMVAADKLKTMLLDRNKDKLEASIIFKTASGKIIKFEPRSIVNGNIFIGPYDITKPNHFEFSYS